MGMATAPIAIPMYEKGKPGRLLRSPVIIPAGSRVYLKEIERPDGSKRHSRMHLVVTPPEPAAT
jgi:hypothetical protein